MNVAVFGVNHKTASVALRERLAIDPDALLDRLATFPAEAGLREAAVVATCNRTELYAVLEDDEAALRRAFLRLVCAAGMEEGIGYFHEGRAACQHAMRVASGLDSLVLGERQILGQVKDACALARRAGSLGPMLDKLFSAALHAAKRVQTETELASGAVSVASAAIVLAEKVLGSLSGRRVAVVGAGDTAALAARHLSERHPGRLLILNRTAARAEHLAADVGGAARPLEALPVVLSDSDLVLCATRAPEPLVTAGMVRSALAARPDRSLVIVDISVPRNVAPEAAEADNVFVYPIDALAAVVDHSLARRRREAANAEAIVGEEAERFAVWLRSLDATPAVRELREHFERVRADEVRRSLKHFPPSEQEHVERLTKALVNKLLHAPTMCLKDQAAEPPAGLTWVEAIRQLFSLGSGRSRQEVGRGH